MSGFTGLSQVNHCMVEPSVPNQQIGLQPDLLQSRSELIIPVVFHIVFSDQSNDFSDLEISAQIDVLNRDFSLMNENLFQIPDQFKPNASNTGIRFCLARTNPSGKETNGITRTMTSITNIGSSISPEGRKRIHYSFLGGQDAWDPDRYLNIWVGDMESVIGFASFPGEAPFFEEDGVIIDPAYFGVLRPAVSNQPNKGHTLTHEIGHYLNLQHLWGANNSNCEEDDLVSDTPLQEGPNFGCPIHPIQSCGSADMFMNFMDFSNDKCIAFFTHGQTDRMRQTLMSTRKGLLSGFVSCHNPGMLDEDAFKQNFNFHYLRDVSAILVRQVEPTSSTIKIECFGVDGRLYSEYQFEGERTFLIPTEYLPTGTLVLRVSRMDVHFSQMIVLY